MCSNKEKNYCCCTITIISALLGAIGIAGIYYSGLLTGIAPIVYITLVLGILGLLYIIISALCCCSHTNNCLVPLSVGGIISAAFALAIPFVGNTLSLILIIIAVSFFMIMLLINLVYFIVYLLTGN